MDIFRYISNLLYWYNRFVKIIVVNLLYKISYKCFVLLDYNLLVEV